MSFKAFTKRVLDHPRIASSPSNPKSSDDSLVLAIKDELLVSQQLTGQVNQLLMNYPGGDPVVSAPVTTVFHNVAPPGGNQVDILQLTLPAGVDVFDVTDYLRSQLAGQERSVSPNHILIPAPNGDQCPSGPPKKLNGTLPTLPPAAPSAGGFQSVIVLDSGYQWQADWGTNPLESRGHFKAQQAEYYLSKGGSPPQFVWELFAADVLSAIRRNVLDHLAGHANFVAGVIAQNCPAAEITIWNHNGAFVERDLYSLPTEAVVLHSLAAIPIEPVPVVNCGFAFLPYSGTGAVGGVHIAWDDALARINHVGGLIVAPAGNQFGSTLWRYPAVMAGVIGVASHEEPVGGVPATPSKFSNLGPWVTCSANGSKVVSTFLHVKMRVEEGSFFKQDFTSNWGEWNGTSFAAPKVAAAIAKRASGVLPNAAWAALQDAHVNQQDPNNMLGIIFSEQDLA